MPEASAQPSFYCLASYEKGQAFLREAARLGCRVTLLTTEKLRDADWPRESITDFLTMPSGLTPEQVLNTVCYYARSHKIDRIVPLDEFDQESAALVREHMRLPGQGQTMMRFTRDKLAMRTQAQVCGVRVPEFIGVFNHAEIAAFLRDVPGPWLLKPRMNASAIGIKPIAHADEIWPVLDTLGDEASHYVLERFIAGEVYHVEGVTWDSKLLFRQPFKYGKPPIQTMHQGGVFTTRALDLHSPDGLGLSEIHEHMLRGMHLKAAVTHSEFIKATADGKFYFLETAARVGGAHIAEICEFATGINPWVEWARIEYAAATGARYALPPTRQEFSGSVICLARQQQPDLSAYDAPEIAMRMHKEYHAGVLLASPSEPRIQALLEEYVPRFLNDFCAVVPPPERPQN